MGRKQKYTKEVKSQACEDYLSGKSSASEIAQKLKMPKSGNRRIFEWFKQYQAFGEKAFEERPRNNSYTKAFKLEVVQEYLSGHASLMDLSIKYRIPIQETIRQWVLKYNVGGEILDYQPKPEVFTMARAKTTKDERLEIVKHCLENKKNYKVSAFIYGVSYAQVYDWVKRYLNNGEGSLSDGRGRNKLLLELSDIEKKDRELKRLKQQNLLLERENELLKKQRDLEAKLISSQVTKK